MRRGEGLQVATLEGIAGIHVMPVTKVGREAVSRLISEDVIPHVLRGSST